MSPSRCPVDPFVFPELGKNRNSDSLEARFNAFKIPESNFLVFEATVRTCREGCQPAYCPGGAGRAETSYGRRKREINATASLESNNTLIEKPEPNKNDTGVSLEITDKKQITKEKEEEKEKETEYPEYVREMIEVSFQL